mmetsp:Transcript_73633/g.163654  ORF Transcript_73633/g.163654 Transcript_73633/m.163654 type:complete len:199 (-) Transcript_73633:431-1027(-)
MLHRSERISHYHGHHCHHISPETDGCPRCHQHFCFVCLLPHGTPGNEERNPACPHGSGYCHSEGIEDHLVMEPFPHDRRCGCPICPDCRRGHPCENCDGDCVVCEGTVQPGPSEMHAPAGWTVASSFQLPNRDGAMEGEGEEEDNYRDLLAQLLDNLAGARNLDQAQILGLLERFQGEDEPDVEALLHQMMGLVTAER